LFTAAGKPNEENVGHAKVTSMSKTHLTSQ